MKITDIPPSRLTEQQLFAEYVELMDDFSRTLEGYDAVQYEKRRMELLAEIGERLETLEAVKALIGDEFAHDPEFTQPSRDEMKR
ncbi:hypothetical protein SAMN05421858_4022 [Haladaptatus litoreus]|uniref:Uncharacterized protein n=1 Tax=Haladaptatus litoreus TaxID=553468 RepID=A0A1N7E4V5_9EURY|nr:hypothetical protein [Haladaptatus litoreus]SIR83129.1 hypothetical protein SAMN05421858_4022 [Haladaptatus litoreus]